MAKKDEFFLSEDIDQQIEDVKQSKEGDQSDAEALIYLSSYYQADTSHQQETLDRIWNRIADAPLLQQNIQERREKRPLQNYTPIEAMGGSHGARSPRHSLVHRLNTLVAAILLVALLGGMAAVLYTIRQHAGTNASPKISSSLVVSVGVVPSQQAVGSTETVLTTIKGFTLYIHKWQGTSGFTCDGSCAKTWKPLIYTGTGTPTSTTTLPGKLSVGTDFGHKFVFYQGYPLYTYVGDKKPGDFNARMADDSPWQPATPNVPTGL